MAVISIRLDKDEEKILRFLSQEYEQDKSSLIRKSINEMYEDYLDKNFIDEFELREKEQEVSYFSAEEILGSM